jgi:hypothetical protein
VYCYSWLMVLPTLRSVAERLSRGVVFRRNLPARFRGIPFTPPESGLRIWAPANKFGPFPVPYGFAAAAVAGIEGKVLAVEADPWLCALLNRTVAANRTREMAAVSVLSSAVSDHMGISSLLTSARARASNHLETDKGSSEFQEARARVPVATFTLELALDHIPPRQY